MSKYNIALIGAGAMGTRWLEGIHNTKSVRLVAVCDKKKVRAEKAAQNISPCAIHKDFVRIAKRDDIDAAIIVLPHNLLAQASRVFLEHGKHVLCEKPGGVKSKDIQKNIEIARKKRLRYMVGFNHRFHDGFAKAKKFFDKGVIGKPLFIRAKYGFGGRSDYTMEWRLKKEFGGGELTDQCVHIIDLARWFLGTPRKVCGFAEDLFWKSGVEDNAFVVMKHKGNTLSSLHASWSMWKANHVFEIYGTKGYLVIDGLGKKYKGELGGAEKLIVGARTKDYKEKEKIIKCETNANVSLAKELKEFVSAIRERREPSPSAKDAFEVLKITEKIGKKK
jgi:predicted dehydrogenase